MNLQEMWNSPETKGDMLDAMLEQKQFLHHPSKGPLEKLRSNLVKNISIAVILTLGYACLIFYFPYWQIQVGLLITICLNLALMWQAYEQYKNIAPALSSGNVLQTLKHIHASFKKMFRQQERTALLVYPVACAAGFMLGGVIGWGKSVEAFMGAAKAQIALAICIVVLVPIGYYLAKWMNKVKFGKYIDQIKEHIDALEREE
jgi:ABC-type nitrate/sulfonate/bicarbonate transport system permease component